MGAGYGRLLSGFQSEGEMLMSRVVSTHFSPGLTVTVSPVESVCISSADRV